MEHKDENNAKFNKIFVQMQSQIGHDDYQKFQRHQYKWHHMTLRASSPVLSRVDRPTTEHLVGYKTFSILVNTQWVVESEHNL